MSFDALGSGWAFYLAILVVGTLATDVWRWLGVAIGSRIDEDSTLFATVRGIATALVAALIGNLIVFPSGAIAEVPTMWRAGAFLFGCIAYLIGGERLIVGIVAGEVVLIGAWYLT